ncbi:PKD domain-containing protein [Enterococcus sp. 12E11_DIV0728]|uniref:PKD domain-containing protein n=2 Tax=unclassified Enterococcus TaxID=2608891 RepID=UPI001C383AAA|nr:PKD domain-containing protein [Enterococcus sp. 12E11_DIV0728]
MIGLISKADVYAEEKNVSDYNNPVIDNQEDINEPVPHHKISGHFEGTEKKFNFYFPEPDNWEGRFFQIAYPTFDENASTERVEFGCKNGAYTVQTNGGGGYEVDAAAAAFSREVAREYYKTEKHIYGYIYGGSGGSYQTIGASEKTNDIWDGAVPYVPGSLNAIPNNSFIRAFAGFVLIDKAEQISDAVKPGGGDIYKGLNEIEKEVLNEMKLLGTPIKAWQDWEYLLHTKKSDISANTAAAGLNNPEGLLSFSGSVKMMDPTYSEDFWSLPGYLGTEKSDLGELFQKSRINKTVNIKKINRDKKGKLKSIILDSVPENPKNTGFDYYIQGKDGEETIKGSLDISSKKFTFNDENSEDIFDSINKKTKIKISNDWFLALLTYHRHQVPQEKDYYTWDQFKKDDGSLKYPQRDVNIGSLICGNVSGGADYSGMINNKMILVANLIDCDANPWSADWYAKRVKKALGKNYDDNFRIWYNDNSDHIDSDPATNEKLLVPYTGVLEHALLDLSDWVEKGKEPSKSTNYSVKDSQITDLSNDISERGGIQPIVELTVKKDKKIVVNVGQKVKFNSIAKAMPGSGKIVSVEWDCLGNGDYSASNLSKVSEKVIDNKTFKYNKAGTYYAAVKVTSNRDSNSNSSFSKVQNIDHVRVVVKKGSK